MGSLLWGLSRVASMSDSNTSEGVRIPDCVIWTDLICDKSELIPRISDTCTETSYRSIFCQRRMKPLRVLGVSLDALMSSEDEDEDDNLTKASIGRLVNNEEHENFGHNSAYELLTKEEKDNKRKVPCKKQSSIVTSHMACHDYTRQVFQTHRHAGQGEKACQ